MGRSPPLLEAHCLPSAYRAGVVRPLGPAATANLFFALATSSQRAPLSSWPGLGGTAGTALVTCIRTRWTEEDREGEGVGEEEDWGGGGVYGGGGGLLGEGRGWAVLGGAGLLQTELVAFRVSPSSSSLAWSSSFVLMAAGLDLLVLLLFLFHVISIIVAYHHHHHYYHYHFSPFCSLFFVTKRRMT